MPLGLRPYHKYDNEKDLLEDLEQAKKEYPDFLTKERILEIYKELVDTFENKKITSNHIFDNYLFKSVLNVTDPVEVMKKPVADLTMTQIILALTVISIPVFESILCEYDGEEKYIIFTMSFDVCKWYNKILKSVSIRPWYSKYLNYLHNTIILERFGNLDNAKLMFEIQKLI